MACQSYEDLEIVADQLQLSPISEKTPDVTITTHKRTVDKASMSLVPNDDGLENLFPCLIYGDGNCLPRCGSLFAYGTENKHLDIRARIVLHLVKYKEIYLNADFIRNDRQKSTNDARTFAMFSEFFSGENLTDLAVQRIFEKEVFSIRKSGTYMGAWQMAALANVLNRPVRSVYPLYGGQTVRKELNRTFFPFTSEKQQDQGTVYILWTNLLGDSIPEIQWKPNHFVVLLPIQEPVKHSYEVLNNDAGWEDVSSFFVTFENSLVKIL